MKLIGIVILMALVLFFTYEYDHAEQAKDDDEDF